MRLSVALFIVLSLSLACDDPSTSSEIASALSPIELERVWLDLVSGSAWSIADRSTDPYHPLRDERQVCGMTDFGEEYGGVEISTARCDYLTLTQPISHDLSPGDLIEVVLWHSPLVSETPAEGLINLSLGAVDLWSHPLMIPQNAQSWTLSFEVDEPVAQGERLTFHVHNHGSNSYTLLSARRGRAREVVNAQ